MDKFMNGARSAVNFWAVCSRSTQWIVMPIQGNRKESIAIANTHTHTHKAVEAVALHDVAITVGATECSCIAQEEEELCIDTFEETLVLH